MSSWYQSGTGRDFENKVHVFWSAAVQFDFKIKGRIVTADYKYTILSQSAYGRSQRVASQAARITLTSLGVKTIIGDARAI